MSNFFKEIAYYKNECMKNINQIEKLTGKMLHEIYPGLADEHSNAIEQDNSTHYKSFKYKTDRIIDNLKMD